ALDVSYRDAPERAVQKLEAALDQHPLATLEPFDRPYLRLAEVYAHAGRSERAEQLLAAFEQDSIQPGALFLSGMSAVDPPATSVRAAIALAEGRAQDAVRAYRAWEREGGGACFVVCGGFWLGQAYELLGEEDSALVVYERIASGPGSLFEEMLTLGPTYRRLGELYETRGETDRAIDYYNRFVDLWKSADEELQSQVRDVQARIARLVGERGR
ncbi:MAG: tetratricopeptide repeat protein, partial [Deltaproteobacteria bacterium]|nr:tetratricopeptide repeat protein [Deltaproteobacteria bacterium]